MKKALIFGVTGQDGAYLARLLLAKGYDVYGVKRRASSFNTSRIDEIYVDPHEDNNHFRLIYGDLTDSSNVIRIISDIQPDEIYNLAAQSHVQVSFDVPEYTGNTDALGTLRVLEAIRLNKLEGKTRFYQASTSELYGNSSAQMLDEHSKFEPRSPYAAAKLYAYWMTKNYREAYNMHASNGILFNHESPLRGETFVTQKIAQSVAKIHLGQQQKLYLGNLLAKRDWGHARDYVKGMWQIVQHDVADDFVLATGRAETVQRFVELSFAAVNRSIIWQGEGIDMVGRDADNGDILVQVDPSYYRPTDVNVLIGDASKAKKDLGWEAKYTLEQIVEEMVEAALQEFKHPQRLIQVPKFTDDD